MGKKEKQIKYYNKIEDLQGESLEKRIQFAMDYQIENKINPMPYLGKFDEMVEYKYEELVALCPVTGILDLYKITLNMKPDNLIPELKSLKMYYLGYKDLPIGHEHIAAKIYKEIIELIKPKGMKLTLDVAIRGGIKTQVILRTKDFYL